MMALRWFLACVAFIAFAGCSLNFGFGTSSTEERTIRWEDRSSFMQDGLRWRCDVDASTVEWKVDPLKDGHIRYQRRALCWSE